MGDIGRDSVRLGTFSAIGETYDLVNSVLDTGRISYGPLCIRLEEEFSKLHDCAYGVVSASGTDSLRAALHALKIIHKWDDGDEVIVPATTFVATMNIVEQVGLVPVLVDVLEEDFGIDPFLISSAITSRTRCIIPVNLLGQPANLPAVVRVAKENNLLVIEDSCEAAGVQVDGGMVGSWGDIGCFSFYMAHLITAGVGGIAITDNEEYADMMRSLLNHGRDTIYVTMDDAEGAVGDRLQDIVVSRFSFPRIGYSSRMTELQAALALPQVKRLGVIVEAREAVAGWLTAALQRCVGIKDLDLRLPKCLPGRSHSYMMYGIMVAKEHKLPLVMYLEKRGIETRDILPLINQPVSKRYVTSSYPVSQRILEEGFYIPCHQDMTISDTEWIGSLFYLYAAERGMVQNYYD